jgi:hypothetical protein
MKKNSEQDEKQCKFCNKYYIEGDNFNWSCRTHSSTYADQWWCCGKAAENALGCTSKKHEPREDDADEFDEEEREEMEKMKFANFKCFSCKEIGHEPLECEKDPNMRTLYEPPEELMRIQKSKKSKTKQELGYMEMFNMVMSVDMLGGRMGGLETEEDEEEEELEENFGDFEGLEGFRDVLKSKGDVDFNERKTIIEVEEVHTKEIEREIQAGIKIRSRRGSMDSLSSMMNTGEFRGIQKLNLANLNMLDMSASDFE